MPECSCRGGNPNCFKCGGWGWIGDFDSRPIQENLSNTRKRRGKPTRKVLPEIKPENSRLRVRTFKPPPAIREEKIRKDGCVGFCEKKKALALIMRTPQSDPLELKVHLEAYTDQKPDTVFSMGEEVFVSEPDSLTGLIRIRRKGTLISYWTSIDAVNR
jgi:hypothetical protein